MIREEQGVTDETPEQPPIGGFCDDCGHFAGRHGPDGCTFDRGPGEHTLLDGTPVPQHCACPAMLWLDARWPRPWLPAPDGLTTAVASPGVEP